MEEYIYIKDLLDKLLYDEDGFPVSVTEFNDPVHIMQTFNNRLKSGLIDKKYNGEYFNKKELKNTLTTFSLDPYEFRYLCYFCKDLAETFTINVYQTYSPYKDIEKLSKCLENTKLLRVDKFSIKDRATLLLIKKALDDCISKEKEELETMRQNGDYITLVHSNQTLDNIYRLYLFNKYLSKFLQDKKADKTIQASRDKSLLISRMIYILGLGTHIGKDGKEDYWEEYKDNGDKRNFLKGQLSKYKDVDIQTVNTVYRIFKIG